MVKDKSKYDIVIFTGILYHLKPPLFVLEQVGELCSDAVLLETEIIPEDPRNNFCVRLGPLGQAKMAETNKGFMKFMETTELNGDPTNWWVPDSECVRGMLRTAGFKYFSKPFYIIEGRMLMVASKKEDTILNLDVLGLEE